MSDDDILRILSHEIGHAYLDYDKGNLIEHPDPQAEKTADRAGKMLMDAIEVQNDMITTRLQRYRDSNIQLQEENKRLKALLEQNHIA